MSVLLLIFLSVVIIGSGYGLINAILNVQKASHEKDVADRELAESIQAVKDEARTCMANFGYESCVVGCESVSDSFRAQCLDIMDEIRGTI